VLTLSLFAKPRVLLAAHMAILGLTACSRFGEPGVDETHWKQEVLLHNGTMIVVEGSAARRSSGFPNSRRGPTLWLEFRYPPKGLVFKPKSAREQPIALDIFEEQVYVITIFSASEGFCRNKEPGTYFANFYRFDEKQFVRVDQKSVPIDLMLNNLTGGNFWGMTAATDPDFISWREHARLNSFNPDKPISVVQMFAENEYLRCPN
jgi:hypothetical protein